MADVTKTPAGGYNLRFLFTPRDAAEREGADPAENGGYSVPDYSKHQKKIIDRYYDHRDGIMLDKLGQIVTELFLAESDKKRTTLWTRARKAMVNLNTPPKTIEYLCETRDVEALARNLRDWTAQTKKS